MTEAVVATLGMVACWFLEVAVYDDAPLSSDDAFIALLAATLLYFIVRLIHWACLIWIPFPS